MNRTDRLYAIAEELRAAGNRGRTGQWLADRFEVSSRTIKRDVSALQQAGAPIWAQAGPGGGYVLDGRASLPPVNFTEAEAAALAVALAAGRELPFAADGRAALAKLLAAMPPATRSSTDELTNRLWTRGHGLLARPAVARPIEESLRRQVVVTLEYRGASGEVSVRDAEPVALANTGGRWYLIAYCRLRQYAALVPDRPDCSRSGDGRAGTEPRPCHLRGRAAR